MTSGFRKDIPRTWELTALAEVYKLIGGGTPSTNVSDYWDGDTPWITSADIEGVRQINIRKYVTEKGIKESTTNKVPPKTLLVVTRVGLGKIAIAETPICFSQDLQGLVQNPKLICPEYTLYLLSYELQFLKFAGRGTTISGVTKKQLEELPFPLPPLPEQHRIVAKIEELFSELDKGIEYLKTAQEQLKVYRQALLKHAFEGKLTEKWREENRDKLETADALLKRIQDEREQRYQQQLAELGTGGRQGSRSKAPKSLPPLSKEELADLPQLPRGWRWEKLGNIADVIGGVTKGKNLEGREKLSLPYLRVANVQDGYLDLTEIKQIEVAAKDKNKYRLEFGDVLYTEGGDKDKLGRGAVWRNQINLCIHQNHIFRARILGGVINPEILSLYSQTKSAKKYFFRHAKQTTNLASINLTVLANLPVIIFSQPEQQQVLLEIDGCLSEVDQLDQTITTSLQQAEALRQSILKKAFSGQLVPQDSNDEPASVLLARIKAERSGQVIKMKETLTT